MLKMSISNIRRAMSLNHDVYENLCSTNCYSFALGLDIPESEICEDAYVPGTIAANVYNISPSDIYRLSNEERVELDFRALKLGFEVSSASREASCEFREGYYRRCWDIVLFTDTTGGFHFARVDYDGKLYHKVGWSIFGPRETSIEGIEKNLGFAYKKRYRVSLWKSDK